MTTTLNTGEETQLAQTIEMFEVITQSQPHDYQSLEILKEAYSKLGRESDVLNTSKRIAQAYVQMGQLSSAILEYETILQRCPDDPDVLGALKEIESRANNMTAGPAAESATLPSQLDTSRFRKKSRMSTTAEVDDGRMMMRKVFVEGRLISAGDFDLCWQTPDLTLPPMRVLEPFIYTLSEKGIYPLEKSLKLLADRSRTAFLPLDKYDLDIELTRGFPADLCKRWCVMPFDRMSKSILVATANPFNHQAAKELAQTTTNRLLWYLAPPGELMLNLRKAFR